MDADTKARQAAAIEAYDRARRVRRMKRRLIRLAFTCAWIAIVVKMFYVGTA